MDMVLGCWRDLDSERYPGPQFTGSIPYRAIRIWAKDEELDYDDFRLLVDVITYLDHERFERLASKLKKSAPRGVRR